MPGDPDPDAIDLQDFLSRFWRDATCTVCHGRCWEDPATTCDPAPVRRGRGVLGRTGAGSVVSKRPLSAPEAWVLDPRRAPAHPLGDRRHPWRDGRRLALERPPDPPGGPAFIAVDDAYRSVYFIPEAPSPPRTLLESIRVILHECRRQLYRSPTFGDVVLYAVDQDQALTSLLVAEAVILFLLWVAAPLADRASANLREGRS